MSRGSMRQGWASPLHMFGLTYPTSRVLAHCDGGWVWCDGLCDVGWWGELVVTGCVMWG